MIKILHLVQEIVILLIQETYVLNFREYILSFLLVSEL